MWSSQNISGGDCSSQQRTSDQPHAALRAPNAIPVHGTLRHARQATSTRTGPGPSCNSKRTVKARGQGLGRKALWIQREQQSIQDIQSRDGAVDRNVIFIETLALTQIESTARNMSGDCVSTQGDSSPPESTGDISVPNSEEVAHFLKKLLDLHSRGTDGLTPTGQEGPAAEDTSATPPLESAGSEQTPDSNPTGALPTDHEPGGATRMSKRASGAIAPVSHEGLNSHQ